MLGIGEGDTIALVGDENKNEEENKKTEIYTELQDINQKGTQKEQTMKDTPQFLYPHQEFTASILNLCPEDRQKVVDLIKELATTSENMAQLELEFQELQSSEQKYKAKCNELMKKIDAMTEKHQRLEDEISRLKQKQYGALKVLQDTVTMVSDELEITTKKMETMQSENERLKVKNAKLNQQIVLLEEQIQKDNEFHRIKSANPIHPISTPIDKAHFEPNTNQAEDKLLDELFFKF